MAYLTETSTFETGIYQLELTDPVQGGASGISNTQPQQLANRTRWLYNAVATINSTLPTLAPLASPALTGIPTAPTAAVNSSTTQIATTAYVVNQGYAKLNSPALTGTPTAPTAAAGTATTQVATTAFVAAGFLPLSGGTLTGTLNGTTGAFSGVLTAPTATAGTNSTQVATTAFVGGSLSGQTYNNAVLIGASDDLNTYITPGIYYQNTNANAAIGSNYPAAGGYAGSLIVYRCGPIATNAAGIIQVYRQYNGGPIYSRATLDGTTWTPWRSLAFTDSPSLTGTPTAPTAAAGTNTTQIATTAFVKAQGYTTTAQAAAAAPVQSVAGRTGAVTLAVGDVSGAAPLASPALTGTPTAPTAATATNTTQIATTAFVAAGFLPLSGGTLTGTLNGTTGAFSGVLTAPTATAGTKSTQVATTAFVSSNLSGGIQSFDNRAIQPNNASIFTKSVSAYFVSKAGIETGTAAGADYGDFLILNGYADATGGKTNALLALKLGTQALYHYQATFGATSWDAPKQIAYTDSPALTGTPTAPTPAAGDNSTKVATTAFVATSFAPLASPALTGAPTAPTAAAGTSTTQIATTAFVQANRGSFNNILDVTANTTLTAGQVGINVWISSGSPTITLPSIASVPNGATFTFEAASAVTSPSIATGSDNVVYLNGGIASSLNLQPLDTAVFVADNTISPARWKLVAGTVVNRQKAAANASKSSVGYRITDSGVIEQWGIVAAGDIPSGGFSQSITFPIAFPVALYNLQVTMEDESVNADLFYTTNTISSAGFTVEIHENSAVAQNVTIHWRSIGG